MGALPQQVVPNDTELDLATREALHVMEEAGITTQDLLDALPVAGSELLREWYGAELAADIERRHAAGVRDVRGR